MIPYPKRERTFPPRPGTQSPPRLVAADAGFWFKTNRDAAEAAGVTRVCIPATGRPSAAQRQIQHQRWFRRGLRWRTGCEGRISVLKGRDGLARCRYHGFNGTRRWVGWGVVAHNIHLLITPPRSTLLSSVPGHWGNTPCRRTHFAPESN